MDFILKDNRESLCKEDLERIARIPLHTEWLNAGGQVIPKKKIDALFSKIKSGEIVSWDQVHAFYDECQKEYADYKARYAIYIIERLYSKQITDFSEADYEDISQDVAFVAVNMLESSIAVREKDFTDFFRSITFRNEQEKNAVLGTLDDDEFLKKLKVSTEEFLGSLDKLFKLLR